METPQLANFQNTHWQAYFHGLESVIFKLKNFPFPAVKNGSTFAGSAGGSTMINLPGSHLTFGKVPLTFIVDADFTNFKSVFNWMKNNTIQNEPTMRDCSIHLVDNCGQASNIGFNLEYCFPEELSSFLLQTNNNDVLELTCTLTLHVNDVTFI